MRISHQYKFIFAHVWKTGGTSVEHALKQTCNEGPKRSLFGKKPHSEDFDKHAGFREIKGKLNPKYFNNYFKFAFVRNPLSWQVSFYHFIVQHPNNHPRCEVIRSLSNFEAYIHWSVENEMHLHKQSKFVFDENGNQLVDFIGKYENLSADYSTIAKKLGFKQSELPSLNSSKHDDYMSYYTAETEALVRDCLREDFELLKY